MTIQGAGTCSDRPTVSDFDQPAASTSPAAPRAGGLGWRSTILDAQGEAAARAYLITTEQFVDVLAQETRRSPGMSLDLEPRFRGDRYSTGVGGYSILVRVGET